MTIKNRLNELENSFNDFENILILIHAIKIEIFERAISFINALNLLISPRTVAHKSTKMFSENLVTCFVHLYRDI